MGIKNKGVKNMSNKNIEGMKKLIEEKKKANSQRSAKSERPVQKIGQARKAFKNKKTGGTFDK